jgi:L-alanine-DL-glutamate epimerase-like enolase superfamily enzyme
MGTEAFMRQQIKEKLNAGFSTLKLKIGAIDFESEISLLKSIRNEFSSEEIEIRLMPTVVFFRQKLWKN